MNLSYPNSAQNATEEGNSPRGSGRERLLGVVVALSKPVLALAVIAAIVLLVLAFPGQLAHDSGALLATAILGILRLLADLYPAHARRGRLAEGTVAVDFALLLLVGLGGATLAAGLAATVRTIKETSRERTVHPLITIARAVVVVGLAGLAYDLLSDWPALPLQSANLPAVAAASATYMALDVLLVLVSLVPGQRETFRHNWRSRAQLAVLQYGVLFGLGLIGAMVYDFSPIACLILVLPVGVAQFTLRTAIASRRAIRAAIESLAVEIDDREAYTAQHSERCASYARKICQGLRLNGYETELIVGVAKIHDLGKMNIWPEMLNKAGPLDDAERLEMNRHPAYGAEILAGFVDYRHARDIIMHHHERYDGKGYPAGLKGEDIPLGSRVVAVVDAFDAMTSHRPYRPAMSFESAVRELQVNAGRQFDPKVVDVFVAAVRPEDIPASAATRPFTRTAEPARG